MKVRLDAFFFCFCFVRFWAHLQSHYFVECPNFTYLQYKINGFSILCNTCYAASCYLKFTCSNSTLRVLEKAVKYIQSCKQKHYFLDCFGVLLVILIINRPWKFFYLCASIHKVTHLLGQFSFQSRHLKVACYF